MESKSVENGDQTIPSAAAMKIEMGKAHQPSQETLDAAEALKVEGNALLGGKSRAQGKDRGSTGSKRTTARFSVPNNQRRLCCYR